MFLFVNSCQVNHQTTILIYVQKKKILFGHKGTSKQHVIITLDMQRKIFIFVFYNGCANNAPSGDKKHC